MGYTRYNYTKERFDKYRNKLKFLKQAIDSNTKECFSIRSCYFEELFRKIYNTYTVRSAKYPDVYRTQELKENLYSVSAETMSFDEFSDKFDHAICNAEYTPNIKSVINTMHDLNYIDSFKHSYLVNSLNLMYRIRCEETTKIIKRDRKMNMSADRGKELSERVTSGSRFLSEIKKQPQQSHSSVKDNDKRYDMEV